MINLKKYFLLALVPLCQLSLLGNAQQLGNLKNVDVSHFPEVKLTVQIRDPELLDSSRLVVQESGKTISKFSIQEVKREVETRPKAIFILFENSFFSVFQAQREYFKTLLRDVVAEGFSDKDKIYFTEFDWTDNAGKVLNESKIALTAKDDLVSLIDQVAQPPRGSKIHEFTELNIALMEAIDYLGSQPLDSSYVRAVLMLSGEMSNIYNQRYADLDIIRASVTKNIPVYAVRYPRVARKYTLKRISDETFGRHLEANSDYPDSTRNAAVTLMKQIPERAVGKTYELAYQSEAAVGKQAVLIILKDDVQIRNYGFSFTSPGYKEWIYQDTLRVGILWSIPVLIFGLIITIGVVVRKRGIRYRKQQEQRLQVIREENEQKLARHQHAIEDRIAQQEMDAKRNDDLALRKHEDQQSWDRFHAQVRKSVLTDMQGNKYTLNDPVTTIGRGNDVSVQIHDTTVSRKHASVLFEKQSPESLPVAGSGYYLVDLDSANGTYINSQRVINTAPLNDGDMIQVGNVKLSFRC